uniref:Neurotransmitter-gated ion-channel ligand-binding domain-containing protein n=1 Tax=Knipowitschia caucasica TaxID=637954 RepID=A0AAV2LC79_KNICA
MIIMRLAALPLLLCCSVTSLQNCSYHDVLNHVQLNQKRDLFTLIRPVRNHSHVTEVELDVLVYAILDVREIDQTFISYIWVVMQWRNEFIHWDQEEFCGIEAVAVPIEMLRKPDITIEEMYVSQCSQYHSVGPGNTRKRQVQIHHSSHEAHGKKTLQLHT